MYGIALSVVACLRGGTRVDVAWNLDPDKAPDFDPADAIALTPGGGRLGSLLHGAVDGQLSEIAGVQAIHGRVLSIEIGPLESSICGIEAGQSIRAMLTPATELPEDLWQHLLDRDPVCLVSHLDGDSVTGTDLYTASTVAEAGEEAARLLSRGAGAVVVTDEAVITVLSPRPTLVVMGAGEMAEGLSAAAALLGWHATVTTNTDEAIGMTAALAGLDGVVVMGHDTESVGRVLESALSSGAGYIGSLGPRSLQKDRVDWLAFRGITDLDRLHAPAGLDIGARSPREVAVAIVAEMIATRTAVDG